jgi:hypothetical protein
LFLFLLTSFFLSKDKKKTITTIIIMPLAQLLTALEILRIGLVLAGFSMERTVLDGDLNLRRFKAFYGSSHDTLAAIWDDMRTCTIVQARPDPTEDGILFF